MIHIALYLFSIWLQRNKISLAYQEFLQLVAKQYDFDDRRLKQSCKRFLDPSIALPFYKALQTYSIKPPSEGLYVQAFFNLMGLTFVLRFLDAVTDVSLTSQYFSICNIDLDNGVMLNDTICYLTESQWLIPGWIPGKLLI